MEEKIYGNEQTLYGKEDFIKKFDNFSLVFVTEDSVYKAKIKDFIKSKDPVLFEELKNLYKDLASEEITEENKLKSYNLYLMLRNEGKFSNKELGLEYW